MRSEIVRMSVGRERVRVTCDFWFHNSGRACKVRMGFPDRGEGDSDPGRSDPKSAPKGTFLSYASFVDGKSVPTQIVRSSDSSQVWHTKTVSFGAGTTRRVRDVYTLDTGGMGTGGGAYLQTYYILHTGASWRGPIGRAEIWVTFAPDAVTAPVRLVALHRLPGKSLEHYVWGKQGRGTVVWDGPSRPTVRGRTLRFERANWEPTEKDDVFLAFGYRTSTQLSH